MKFQFLDKFSQAVVPFCCGVFTAVILLPFNWLKWEYMGELGGLLGGLATVALAFFGWQVKNEYINNLQIDYRVQFFEDMCDFLNVVEPIVAHCKSNIDHFGISDIESIKDTYRKDQKAKENFENWLKYVNKYPFILNNRKRHNSYDQVLVLASSCFNKLTKELNIMLKLNVKNTLDFDNKPLIDSARAIVSLGDDCRELRNSIYRLKLYN